MAKDLLIREPREGDLARLTEIYNHYILETAVTFEVEPYTVEGRRPWLAQFAATGRYRILVAESSGRVAGWANSRRFHERAAYDPTIETSIYLDSAVRGRGIATQLYSALFDLLKGEDVHLAIGGITLPNEASVALHRKLGFEPVGVLTEVGRMVGGGMSGGSRSGWADLPARWDVGWFQKRMG